MLRSANASGCDCFLRLKDTKCRSYCRKSLRLHLARAKSPALESSQSKSLGRFLHECSYSEASEKLSELLLFFPPKFRSLASGLGSRKTAPAIPLSAGHQVIASELVSGSSWVPMPILARWRPKEPADVQHVRCCCPRGVCWLAQLVALELDKLNKWGMCGWEFRFGSQITGCSSSSSTSGLTLLNHTSALMFCNTSIPPLLPWGPHAHWRRSEQKSNQIRDRKQDTIRPKNCQTGLSAEEASVAASTTWATL